MDVGPLYRGTRERITDLVRAEPDAGKKIVLATPEWTVKDVVGHLAGVCADILSGNIAGVATDPWTAAQVAARKDRPLDEVLDEWSTIAPQVEEMAHLFGEAGEQWIADVVTHEQDLRGTLGRPGARQGPAVDVAIAFMGRWFTRTLAGNDVTGLKVRVGENEWATDEGPAKATLIAAPFDFMRAVTGRRSRAQIRNLEWEGDPAPYLDAFEWGPFRPAAEDIIEN